MFKKKEPVVKDSKKEKNTGGAKPLDGASVDKPKKRAAKSASKSLSSWLYQPALIVLGAFVLSYILVDMLSLAENEERFQKAIAEQKLSSVKRTFEDYLAGKKKALDGLSAKSFGELDAGQGLLMLKAVWPELEDFYRVSKQELVDTRGHYPELSFASVDLLRRALKKQATVVETFFNKKWYLQIASPIQAKKTVSDELATNSGGVQLVVFNLSALKANLQRNEAVNTGEIALLGIQDKQILALGSGADLAAVTSATSVPELKVRYTANSSQLLEIDRLILLIIMAVTCIVAVLAVVLVSRSNIAKIRKDIQQLSHSLSKAMSGGRLNSSFSYGEFVSMTNAVIEPLKQLVANSKEATKAKESAEKALASMDQTQNIPAKSMADDSDAPLFDDDLLDLDVLSENDGLDDGGGMLSEVKGLDVDVPQSIFRAYDIRGIVDESLNDGIVELLGKAIASEALTQGQQALCVAYDGRLSSRPYCEALTRGILSTGTDLIIIGQVPTPVLYFSTHEFDTGSGIMITGSHNPSNYNGFKIMIAGRTLSGDDIQKLYNRILLQDFAQGQGTCTERDVSREYIDTILNDIAVAAPLKVVLDAGNGVAGTIAPELIEELGCEVIPLHCDVDGNFPNHHPDPGNPENLQDLITAVKEHDADIGLAFDGDGDRLGVVTNTGKIIWPDRLLMLFAKDVVSRNPGADILFDVKCSRRLNGLISSYGGRPVMWKSGHSLMKAKMQETGALLGGELSGHIFFKERWFGFDDGLYSAARLLEVLGIEDRSSDEVFADFPEDVSTPEINVAVTDESKFIIIESLIALKDQFEGGNISTIDGLRVDYPQGWGLCRASNTTPMLVLRFEADDEAALEEIKMKFKAQLQIVDPSLVCDF